MFIGHFAAGFAVKKWLPDISLGWCFVAARFIDLLWSFLLFSGIESASYRTGRVLRH